MEIHTERVNYISLFSGIGGLEPTSGQPLVFCEIDPASQEVLSRVNPDVKIHGDIRTLEAGKADYVLGGWPCQNLSTAGLMVGLDGAQSRLFFELCRVVKESGAHTAIMENVPGLFMSNGGKDFLYVLRSLDDIGLSHISWRTINSAELGLPQYRERIFIVASRFKNRALALHLNKPPLKRNNIENECSYPEVLGFYWTGGGRSICLRKNAVPTLKVGAPSKKGGTSPIAVFYANIVRKLTPEEAIRIQGFNPEIFRGLGYGDVLRMAGDAVSRPVGAFVVDSVFNLSSEPIIDLLPITQDSIPSHGYSKSGRFWAIQHVRMLNPSHIWDFLDKDVKTELSPQASAGLCCRIINANADVPSDLFETLYEKSKKRTKLLGTTVNSFEILHSQMDPESFLKKLKSKNRVVQLRLF